MSLLDELDGALLVVVDPEYRLAYCWFGSRGINIYDERGVEVDYFTIGGNAKLTPERVLQAIERVMSARD